MIFQREIYISNFSRSVTLVVQWVFPPGSFFVQPIFRERQGTPGNNFFMVFSNKLEYEQKPLGSYMQAVGAFQKYLNEAHIDNL
jgi:hypothetical protein